MSYELRVRWLGVPGYKSLTFGRRQNAIEHAKQLSITPRVKSVSIIRWKTEEIKWLKGPSYRKKGVRVTL